jgi:hypothetical protein
MSRRTRIDSITGAIEVAQRAGREIEPPAHVPLDEADAPFWQSVIAEFARSEWSAHQLELAAMLARDMADVARIQVRLREDGDTIVQPSGNVVANPLMANLRMKTTNIMAMRRSLALHARGKDGDNRDTGKRRDKAKGIEAGLAVDDDFIPRASVN